MLTGIYVRSISKSIHKTPINFANKAVDLGLSFVPILTIFQKANDTRFLNDNTLLPFVEALFDADIKPAIWGYPWIGKEREFIDRMKWAIDKCYGMVKAIIIDPELGYQFKTSSKFESKEGAERLVNGLLDIMTEDIDIGMSSYGAAHLQKRFPWDQYLIGFGSPQYYRANLDNVSRGLTAWRNLGFRELIPSLPLFGPNSGRKLDRYIKHARKAESESIKGFLFWSWRQLNANEAKVIRKLGKEQ